MVTIEYCREGLPVSDFDYDEFLDLVKLNIDNDRTFRVSTTIPIYAVRLEIVRGKIDCKKVVFRYFDCLLMANEFGTIKDWPKGFADKLNALSEDLLRVACQKLRNKNLTK